MLARHHQDLTNSIFRRPGILIIKPLFITAGILRPIVDPMHLFETKKPGN